VSNSTTANRTTANRTTANATLTRRIAAGLLAAVIGIAAGATLAGAPASAVGAVGYVRLAHLSPDTPAVDVYLTSLSGAIPPKVFHAVGYGVVSDYLTVPVGAYAVAMRAQGSPPASPPVLSADVTVAAGAAYTVAGVGRFSGLGIKVIQDDLSPPPAGQAKVRVVQASVRDPLLTISAGGNAIASNVPFASTTAYYNVPGGSLSLTLQPEPSGTATTKAVVLGAGSVYSVIVLDGAAGALNVVVHTDAVGQGKVPTGGVGTGAGGTAQTSMVPGILVGVGLFLGVASFVLLRRVRARAARTL
jgi:hypothetical protein